ncbi:Nucleolar protein 13 [Mycoemilia scoparia]|uniref:Nucleolar protein 13 n=1 Tax=Mycoemilia scoparia TaxID=417184 RepID=A0A9W8A443_9FUNG|nr:Nucleolar protein 13 [Mycoemilia scoparia]
MGKKSKEGKTKSKNKSKDSQPQEEKLLDNAEVPHSIEQSTETIAKKEVHDIENKKAGEDEDDDDSYDFSKLEADIKPDLTKKKEAKKTKKNVNPESTEDLEGIEESDQEEGVKGGSKAKKAQKKPKKSQWCVWIGNLAFATGQAELKEFLRTDKGEITRIHMPKGQYGKPNRGFAYVDFDTEEAMEYAISLSEQELDGRPLLIKNGKNFKKDGKIPASQDSSSTKKKGRENTQPSPTLFVGNLPFEATKQDLRKIFDQFGKIIKVRLATFQDNPQKCKGFGYIDYKDLEGATLAFEDKKSHTLEGKRIRVEYAGELATKKGRPWEHFPVPEHIAQKKGADGSQHQKKRKQSGSAEDAGDEGGDSRQLKTAKILDSSEIRQDRDLETDNMAETKLQGLPVSFKGKKTTFE